MTVATAPAQPALILDGCVVPERWLPVVGYEGLYDVSDMGRVWSLDRVLNDGRHWRGRILKASCNEVRPHPHVSLHRDGQRLCISVHQLVLEAFVGPCPVGMECCHFNDIHTDNRLTNLRWDTYSANRLDCVRNGKHTNKNKTKCKRGHKFTPSNTMIMHNGKARMCRKCHNMHGRQTYRRINGLRGNYNASKTECKEGHRFTPSNTILRRKGSRECRECTNVRAREGYHRRKAVSAR